MHESGVPDPHVDVDAVQLKFPPSGSWFPQVLDHFAFNTRSRNAPSRQG